MPLSVVGKARGEGLGLRVLRKFRFTFPACKPLSVLVCSVLSFADRAQEQGLP